MRPGYGAYAYLQYEGMDTDFGSAFNITPGNFNVVDGEVIHDPDAIIILQADHGARLGYHLKELYDTPYDPETETIHQQNILNCVYWGGKELDISGLSGINTLRTILNAAYGTDYEMLPQPTGFVNYYEES